MDDNITQYLLHNNIKVNENISPISTINNDKVGSEMFRISNIIQTLDTIFGYDTSKLFKNKKIIIEPKSNLYISKATLYNNLSVKKIKHVNKSTKKRIIYKYDINQTIVDTVSNNYDTEKIIVAQIPYSFDFGITTKIKVMVKYHDEEITLYNYEDFDPELARANMFEYESTYINYLAYQIINANVLEYSEVNEYLEDIVGRLLLR